MQLLYSRLLRWSLESGVLILLHLLFNRIGFRITSRLEDWDAYKLLLTFKNNVR